MAPKGVAARVLTTKPTWFSPAHPSSKTTSTCTVNVTTDSTTTTMLGDRRQATVAIVGVPLPLELRMIGAIG